MFRIDHHASCLPGLSLQSPRPQPPSPAPKLPLLQPPSPAPYPGRVQESPNEVQSVFSSWVTLSHSSATASEVRCGRRTQLANWGPPEVSTIWQRRKSGQAIRPS